MADQQMTDFLNDVVGVVEANSFEKLCLWKEYSEEHNVAWEQRADGLMEVVGKLDGMPVCLSLTTAKVGGYKLLFIDATSKVVDYRLIEKWLSDTLPESAKRHGTQYINKVDAMNFPNVFPANPIKHRAA